MRLLTGSWTDLPLFAVIFLTEKVGQVLGLYAEKIGTGLDALLLTLGVLGFLLGTFLNKGR
jgi:F420-0:gamma-glutamyl ligase-like protein